MSDSKIEIENLLSEKIEMLSADIDFAFSLIDLSFQLNPFPIENRKNFSACYLSVLRDIGSNDDCSDYVKCTRQSWFEKMHSLPYIKQLSFTLMDSNRLSKDDAQFDAVFFFGFLHWIHLENERLLSCYEAYRLTKKNGYLVFCEPQFLATKHSKKPHVSNGDFVDAASVLNVFSVPQVYEGKLMRIIIVKKNVGSHEE